MLFTEHRWWRGTVGFFTSLILMLTLGAPALATGFAADAAPLAGRGLPVPLADFERPVDMPASAPRVAADSQPQTPAPAGRARSARPAAVEYQRLALRQGDLDILAHLVRAEAGDEPYAGKVAVAAVVINRVQSGRFPRSVYGVVFEKDAFESVSNGWYWNPPAPADYAAVREALRGWDPSGGALFFFNPAKTANAFVWSRPILTQIGNHVFSR